MILDKCPLPTATLEEGGGTHFSIIQTTNAIYPQSGGLHVPEFPSQKSLK
jgi:hypothetical protein